MKGNNLTSPTPTTCLVIFTASSKDRKMNPLIKGKTQKALSPDWQMREKGQAFSQSGI